jgi:hypothetical protein
VVENIRRLDQVLDDQAALEVLNTPGRTIDDALRIAQPQVGPDWREPLERAVKALDVVPISDLEHLSDEDKSLIEELMEIAQRRLDQAASFST